MDLQPGVTGFAGRKEPCPPPECAPDLRAFRSHCYEVARLVGATVLSVEHPSDRGVPTSYATARLQFSDTVIVVLLNRTYPILAFAQCPREGQVVFDYVDCPKLAEAFQALGPYTVATCEELSRPLKRELCTRLTATEQKQVRCFRPGRVGDVIFNYWD